MPEVPVKVLIVEDENIIAIDIKASLQKLGCKVTGVVSRGEKAIQHVERDKPDIILMDISLAGELDGIQAAEIISRKYNIPVIYLSALTDDETLKRARVTEPFGYILKPFDERGLRTTIDMALYKHKVETELKIRTKELEEEKIKTDKLLHNIFPAEIVKELKQYGSVSPRHYKMISILFTDFHKFTDIASSLSPQKLVYELNEIFTGFDTIIEKLGLEKLKTIGDSYMICGGLPNEIPDHAIKVVRAAMLMQEFIGERNKNSKLKWQMRAGVHSGQVVAGIAGINKYTYDVWGDTVNIASRMESCCEPGKVNISGITYNLIKDHFDCFYRGRLEAKGKGEIDMYFVQKIKTPVEELSFETG
jgi:class 3 adenylate cyclase